MNSVSGEVIEEQLRFYSDYISTEIAKGRAEEEVISELSAPNLLARSIIDAADAGGDRVARTTPFRYEEKDINYASDEEDLQYKGTSSEERASYDRASYDRAESPRYERRESSSSGSGNYSSGRVYGDRENTNYHNTGYGNGRENHGYRPYIPVSSTGCLLFTIVVIALLVLVVLVFVGILSFLAPILFPVLCIAVILWLLSGILNR